MTWHHYPNSPYGNVDICDHGCVRSHSATKPECIYCDYPIDSDFKMLHCEHCNPNTEILNWFLDNKCIKCGNPI